MNIKKYDGIAVVFRFSFIFKGFFLALLVVCNLPSFEHVLVCDKYGRLLVLGLKSYKWSESLASLNAASMISFMAKSLVVFTNFCRDFNVLFNKFHKFLFFNRLKCKCQKTTLIWQIKQQIS